jgi:hypothetical protein
MTLAPRILVNFIAGLRTARFAKQLKSTGNGLAAQKTIFTRLLTALGRSQLGHRQGLHAGMDYDSFRQSQPLVESLHYEPFVAAMAGGEADVLWPGRCQFFVETAGTTTGTPRRLPITNEMLANYQAGLSAAVFIHAAQAGHAGIFLGRQLQVGASTALKEIGDAFSGNFDAINHLALSPWVEANLYAPSAKLARLPDAPAKTAAIADQMLSDDVTLIGGKPTAVRLLADTVRTRGTRGKAHITTLQALWPNLECYLHTGAPLGLLTPELKLLLGPSVVFREVYAAAEGWFAVQDGKPADGLRLLTDAGIFFEFLPMSDYDDTLPAHLGRACVPLAQAQPGVDYALVITTPAGLCRYVVGDIVRFVSIETPRLHFVGRIRLQLAAFDEHVSERELNESLLEVCTSHNWVPVNFHVAPYYFRVGVNPRGGHEWWIELRPGTVKTPTGPLLAGELDEALARRNLLYRKLRQDLGVEPPIVRLVMPGVFEQWAGKHREQSGGGLPCCRPDRLIADQLTSLTRFHAGEAMIS